jgi:NADPH:quinone reductase-like Zn-dependent oxidoreductase
MIASPVNPYDLLVVKGRYGALPKLPATPGFEGVGVVEKSGGGLIGRFAVGKRVAVLNDRGGNWAEYVVIPARQARPVAADIPDEQVASFFVNPASVLAMVRHILKVPKGEWLLQSAAGSELGKMLIRFCRREGIPTINVVRRNDAVEELKALGGDVVISSADSPIEPQVRAVTKGVGVKFAVDSVGGETGTQLFKSLAEGGRFLLYGVLSEEPIRIDPREMIAGRRVVQGFWLGHWMRERNIPSSLLLFREIARQIREGVLSTDVGAQFSLDAIGDAVAAAEVVGRRGKVLLVLAGS